MDQSLRNGWMFRLDIFSLQKTVCQRQASHQSNNSNGQLFVTDFQVYIKVFKKGFLELHVLNIMLHKMIISLCICDLLCFVSGLFGVKQSGGKNLTGEFFDALDSLSPILIH